MNQLYCGDKELQRELNQLCRAISRDRVTESDLLEVIALIGIEQNPDAICEKRLNPPQQELL